MSLPDTRGFSGGGSAILQSQGGRRKNVRGSASTASLPGRSRNLRSRSQQRYEQAIPGEFFYKSFDKQLGRKVGMVTWTARKEMRKVHCANIRNSKSHVRIDVEKHAAKTKKMFKIFDTTAIRARQKALEDERIQRDNMQLLGLIQKLDELPSIIKDANKPEWRRKHKKIGANKVKFLRIAQQVKLDRINKHNQDLLRKIKKARGYIDRGDQNAHYKRHLRLRKAMRKVDDHVGGRRRRQRGGRGRARMGSRAKSRGTASEYSDRSQLSTRQRVMTSDDRLLQHMYRSALDSASSGGEFDPFYSRPSTVFSMGGSSLAEDSGIYWGGVHEESSTVLPMGSMNDMGSGSQILPEQFPPLMPQKPMNTDKLIHPSH